MNSPRELYLAACAEISDSLSPLGFKFAKSGPHTQRKDEEFTYRIWFQSSHHNVADHRVDLWIHVKVLSKRLAAWRAAQARVLGYEDVAAGGQIGNLVRPHGWRDWNLAVSTRSDVIADAIATVHSIALPYFARFSDIPNLCALLQRETLPGMEIAQTLEFLLCFADRSEADFALMSFFRSRPDLLPEYEKHLREFRERGLPRISSSGFAHNLAFVTVAYGLTSPNAN